MGSSKHLKQLLKEDHEPFVLQNYINERRLHLKKPLQVQKRLPISQNTTFRCKNACFFSSCQDVQNSPPFDFSSSSPTKTQNTNTFFVHIPAGTAALLLEAALRIQNTQKSKTPKTHNFGFFGLILKKITSRKKNRERGNERSDGVKLSVKDILKWESNDALKLKTERTLKTEETEEASVGVEEKRNSDVGLSCSCNSRLSSAWTEKSLDLETCTSRSEDSEETEFVRDESKIGDFGSCEKEICSSSRSPGRHSQGSEFPVGFPVLRSSGLDYTVTSPGLRKKLVVENEEQLNPVKKDFEEAEEHCSPVSVLDPQFEDEDEGREDNEDEQENGNELERSFAFMNSAKLQLLEKLRRFELLAELDPLELEKRSAEEDEDDEEEEEEENDNKVANVSVKEVVTGPSNLPPGRLSWDMKRLARDLTLEEGPSNNRMSKSDTIDMMIEFDFKKESIEWLKFQEDVQEAGATIEHAIFSFLLEELSVELLHSSEP